MAENEPSESIGLNGSYHSTSTEEKSICKEPVSSQHVILNENIATKEIIAVEKMNNDVLFKTADNHTISAASNGELTCSQKSIAIPANNASQINHKTSTNDSSVNVPSINAASITDLSPSTGISDLDTVDSNTRTDKISHEINGVTSEMDEHSNMKKVTFVDNDITANSPQEASSATVETTANQTPEGIVFLFELHDLPCCNFFFYLPYLSSIHEKAMNRYVLDGKSALAWELPFPGHLSST